jgi:hypothetical protein
LTTSPRAGSLSTTSPTPRVRVPRHVARLVTRLVVDYSASRRLVVDYFGYAARPVASARRAARRMARCRLLRLRRASGCLGSSRGSLSTTPTKPHVRVPRHVAWLIVNYFTYTARLVASARRAACRVTHRRLLRIVQARRRLLRLRCASGCLGTSRGSSSGSSSTTPPRAGSLSTTSTTPRVRLLRHITWLLVDYFTSAARLGASACRAVRQAARRRLLHLRRASGCFGSSHGLSRDSSSTTSRTPRVRMPRNVARLVKQLVVNYFTYAARPVASARRAACRVTHRRLLRLAQARCQLHRLRRASGCLGTSRGSSRGSSSTTPPRAGSSSTTSTTRASGCFGTSRRTSRRSSSTTSARAGSSSTTSPSPRVRVARFIARLVVDYFDYAARPGASARRAACCRLL